MIISNIGINHSRLTLSMLFILLIILQLPLASMMHHKHALSIHQTQYDRFFVKYRNTDIINAFLIMFIKLSGLSHHSLVLLCRFCSTQLSSYLYSSVFGE